MAYKETFWMACDSTEQLRAEYGPFHTRVEAEQEARKLGFTYLLRYEHIIGDNEPAAKRRFTMNPGKRKYGQISTSLNTRATAYVFSSKPRRKG